MASQWNDDFDFDEVDYRHGDRKAKETKQVPKQEDDYFAAEEDTKSVKLPVISKAAASAARITNG